MKDKKIIKKISLISLLLICILAISTILTYLYLIPEIAKSKFLSDTLNKIIYDFTKMELVYHNVQLKTYLKPRIDLKIGNLTLSKDSINLIELSNFETSLSFEKIFSKKIKLNKLLATTLIIKADKLIEALNIEQKETQQKQEIDWKLDIYSSKIKLDELELSYKQNGATCDLYSRDIALVQDNDQKNLEFNFEAIISKNSKIYADIASSSINEVKIYKDKIEIDNLFVLINDSRLLLNSTIDQKNILLNAKSDKFTLNDIFNLINSNIIIPNGENLLKPLQNPSGQVSFDVNSNNNNLSGYIKINNTKAHLKDVSSIPVNISEGKINITPNEITFSNLKGYYGKNKNNGIKIYGSIKDYYKTLDSNITIDTAVTNEFFKDYLSKLINNITLHTSKPFGTRIIYKAKNNIMDIIWLAKIPKGVNFGIDDTKSALSDYDRAVKGDFHIEGDIFDIRNINYYIAPDIKRGIKLKPILILDAKMNLKGQVSSAGFTFGREMPCEFLNIFAGQKLFKKGTVKGSLHVDFKNNIPILNTNMEINKTLIPSQRLFVKNATLKTNSNLINIYAQGRFKRAKYIFEGKIKNELQPPFVIKNLTLDVDNIDAERLLTTVNNQNQGVKQDTSKIESEDDLANDNYMFDTSFIRIEDGDFILHKGNYKEINFGNIEANLTLDEKGILKIKSNRFDIADGISSLFVNCDLKNLKYYIKLGAKDINSDLMAKVLFNLHKEISGKASGIIELYGDKSLKLNGDIKFIIKDGTIGKIGLVEYVLKIASVFRNPVAMLSPGAIMDIVSIPEGNFEKITGELAIRNNVVNKINIKSYSKTLSALIRGRFDMERHDTSLRIYTRFSSDKKSMFGFLRNISLSALANKVQLNTRNDANYYKSELDELPEINVPNEKTQVFLTQVEGDVEHNNFLSSLKKIK